MIITWDLQFYLVDFDVWNIFLKILYFQTPRPEMTQN